MDTTPLLAIPYPEPTDPITDYPALGQDLAERLEAIAGLAKLWDSVEAGVVLPAATITTPALSQAYQDLVAVILARSSGAAAYVRMRCNGDAGAVYDTGVSNGGGSTTPYALNNGTSAVVGRAEPSTAGASYLGGSIAEILDYANAARHHSILGRGEGLAGSGPGLVVANSGNRYHPAVLAAISTLTFFPDVGNFDAGSKITIYGRK